MKTRTAAITIVVFATIISGCSVQPQPDTTYAGDTLRGLDRDYGLLVIPPSAQPDDIKRWAACSPEGQGNARSALRYVAPWGDEIATAYVAAALDGERTKCLEALLSLMGAKVIAVDPGLATHLRESRLLGRLVETDQPLGYFAMYSFDPTRGRPTVWGLQAPPPAGTPWYLDGAPAFARIVGADSPD